MRFSTETDYSNRFSDVFDAFVSFGPRLKKRPKYFRHRRRAGCLLLKPPGGEHRRPPIFAQAVVVEKPFVIEPRDLGIGCSSSMTRVFCIFSIFDIFGILIISCMFCIDGIIDYWKDSWKDYFLNSSLKNQRKSRKIVPGASKIEPWALQNRA